MDMIVVADINTLWRRKLFEALSASREIIGLAPKDVLLEGRERLLGGANAKSNGQIQNFWAQGVVMPPGWATKFPEWSCRRLWKIASQVAHDAGAVISGLFITSPHYLPMIRQVGKGIPVFYYCSDDYCEYAGWGGQLIKRRERQIVKSVTHSFFVSSVLAERAITEYGVSPEQVTLIPNATSEKFLIPANKEEIKALLSNYCALQHPIVGVVGSINERLDFELLLRCASMPECGTLLMIGPIAKNIRDDAFKQLLSHPNCMFIGSRPHHELRLWMQALHVALIPYVKSQFNYACSPMRLFDHLAAGRPIVATSTCAQVVEFSSLLRIGNSADETLSLLAIACRQSPCEDEVNRLRSSALSQSWLSRAEKVETIIEACGVAYGWARKIS